MANQVIHYSSDQKTIIRKLERFLERLGGSNLDYDFNSSRTDYSAWVSFQYKDQRYRFELTNARLNYFRMTVNSSKDILGMLAFGISDLARLAERGIFDFGRLVESYKSLEFIEVPSWASFMRFDSRPRNMAEVEARYKELVKGAMRPETNREDFEKLQQAYDLAKQYFGVDV